MKIECVKEKLHIAVSNAEKIVTKNNTLPVLSCILFEAKNNTLTIQSTNIDLGFEVSIPVKMKEQGKVAVPAHIIGSFLNTITDDESINLETNEQTLHISTKNHKATIKTISYDDFPTIPTIDGGATFTLSAQDMRNGIKSVLYSAAVSSVKPELASVYLYSNEESIIFVATDSFRLAEKRIQTKKPLKISGILIPFKNATDILKIIDSVAGDITIHTTKNQISFVFAETYLVSRVIDGTFPDYKQILPKEEKTKVTILKQDLLSTLKISNIFSDSFNQMNIAAMPGAKTIEVKTKNANVGESTNTISARVEGETIAVNFNYRYITDSLQSIASDSITLSFNGTTKPLVIRGSADSSFTYLVMPMNR